MRAAASSVGPVLMAEVTEWVLVARSGAATVVLCWAGAVTVARAMPGLVTVRHPLDPEPVGSTKATAVLVLGVLAVVTGPLVGGAAPAVIALMLARQARADLVAGRGYLTGAERVRRGEVLALIGLGLVALTVVTAAVAAILTVAGGPVPYDFPDTVD